MNSLATIVIFVLGVVVPLLTVFVLLVGLK